MGFMEEKEVQPLQYVHFAKERVCASLGEFRLFKTQYACCHFLAGSKHVLHDLTRGLATIIMKLAIRFCSISVKYRIGILQHLFQSIDQYMLVSGQVNNIFEY